MSSGGVVRSLFSAFNDGDFERLQGLVGPDAAVRQPLPDVGLPAASRFGGTYTGPREIAGVAKRLHDELGGARLELRGLEENGPAVLVEFMALIGPADERSALLGWGVLQVENGKLAKSEAFPSEESARRAYERVA